MIIYHFGGRDEAVISLTGVLWRIHTEERALLATLGAPYRAYAAQHKRLVPLVW